MVSSVSSGGGSNIAQLAKQLPQVQSNNSQSNPLEALQKNRPAPQHTAPAHSAPAPTVNTQGQRTGSVINTTA